MKATYERGDKVLYPVAYSGDAASLYKNGVVEAIMGDNIYLGQGLVVPADKVLPCMDSLKEIVNKVEGIESFRMVG